MSVYKIVISSKDPEVLQMSRAEFSKKFIATHYRAVTAFLMGVQTIFLDNSDVYTTDPELVDSVSLKTHWWERLTSQEHRVHLQSCAWGGLSIFSETGHRNVTNLQGFIQAFAPKTYMYPNMQKWPFISALDPQLISFASEPEVRTEFSNLRRNDASDRITLFSVCEALLDKKGRFFTIEKVCRALSQIINATQDSILQLKLPIAEPYPSCVKYIQIGSNVGLQPSDRSHATLPNKNFYVAPREVRNESLYMLDGLPAPFKRETTSFTEIANSVFLQIFQYRQLGNGASALICPEVMTYLVHADRVLYYDLPHLLFLHKIALMDTYLRYVVESTKSSLSSVLNMGYKHIVRANDVVAPTSEPAKKFFSKTSPELLAAVQVYPPIQSCAYVDPSLVEELCDLYLTHASLSESTCVARLEKILSDYSKQQTIKWVILSRIYRRSRLDMKFTVPSDIEFAQLVASAFPRKDAR